MKKYMYFTFMCRVCYKSDVMTVFAAFSMDDKESVPGIP